MMFLSFFVILFVLGLCVHGDDTFPAVQKFFQASEYTKFDDSMDVAGSRRGMINVDFKDENGNDDYINLFRVDLIGTNQQRGFAHGALLAHEIRDFAVVALDKYLIQMIQEIDLSQFPEELQKILEKAMKGLEVLAPRIAHKAMLWVWNKEEKYLPQSLIDEIDGIAEGICSVLSKEDKKKECDVKEWRDNIRAVNMFPELIRMSCTAYGAWGDATTQSLNGGLLQLRALDFGGGPFANFTVVQTHRNDPNNPDHAFVSISFPGMVGVITGLAQNGIGVSEKVWMTNGKKNLQHGNYDGVADVMMLREILEKSKTKEDAETYMQSIKRTFAIWVGVGDFESQKFDLVGYTEKAATVYTDETMPKMNGQPYLKSIAYVDKHPQPSHDGVNGTLPTALQHFYGDISMETTSQIINYHQTGDLHAAAYDFTNKKMGLALGKINAEGNYYPLGEESNGDSVWKAYNRPWCIFDLADLWSGKV